MVYAALTLALLNGPIFICIGVAIYGSLAEFGDALRGWLSRLISLEFFDGAIIPPFRIQLLIYAFLAVLWGESAIW